MEQMQGWLLLVLLVNRRVAYTGMKSAVFVLGQVPKMTASAPFPIGSDSS